MNNLFYFSDDELRESLKYLDRSLREQTYYRKWDAMVKEIYQIRQELALRRKMEEL